MTSTPSTFNATVRDGVHIVAPTRADVLDTTYITRLQEELLERVNAAPGAVFVIDLDTVRFLSSTALGMLVVVHKACAQRDGALIVAGASKDIVKALKIIKLHKLVRVYDTADEAVANAHK